MSAAQPSTTSTSTFLSEQTSPPPPPPTFFGEQTLPPTILLSEPTPAFFDRPPVESLLPRTSDEDLLMDDITGNPFVRHKINEGGNTKSYLPECVLCCSDFLNREDHRHSDNCLESFCASSNLFGLVVQPVIEWKLINCRGKPNIHIKLTFEIKYFSFDDFSKQIQKYKNMCKNLLFEIDKNIDYNSLRLIFFHNHHGRSADYSYDKFDDLCFSETDISVQYDILQSDGPSKVCVLNLITVEYDPFPDISNIKIIGHPSHPSQIVPSIIRNSHEKQKNPLNSEISIDLNCIHADSKIKYRMPGIFSTSPKKMRVKPYITVSNISEIFLNSDSNFEIGSESECNMVIIPTICIRLSFKSTEEKIDAYKCFEQEISVQIGNSSPKLVIAFMYNPESSFSYIILVMVKTVNDVGSTTEVLFYIHIDDDQDESSRFPVIRSIGKPDKKGNLHLPDGYSNGYSKLLD
jgi:hypothetical protein